MTTATSATPKVAIKQPSNLSPRIQWLRDYYFQGLNRSWNNEWTSWTTGTPWDFQYEELPFYIVPETYAFFSTFRASFKQDGPARGSAQRLLVVEPARAQGVVRQRGDGQLPTPRAPARRPARGWAIQRPDLHLPEQA